MKPNKRKNFRAPGEYRLKAWEKRAIVRAYEGGELTVLEIAKMFNCTERTVNRCVKPTRLAYKKMITGFTPEQLISFVDMWNDESVSMHDIAKVVGCDPSHLRQIIERELGAKLKPRKHCKHHRSLLRKVHLQLKEGAKINDIIVKYGWSVLRQYYYRRKHNPRWFIPSKRHANI